MGPRFFRAGVRLLVVRDPVCDTVGYEVQGVLRLCWTASRQSHDPAGPRAGSGPLWADGSVGCGIVTFLCPVSAPWKVRLAQRLAHASWRAGPVPAHWQIELGLGPLVERTVYRGSYGPSNVFRYNVC